MRVIVADDDALQRKFTSAVLTKLGHEPLEVPDGLSALRAVRETDAAAIICDINMPGMDGLQVAREVRALNLPRYVHFIIVTGRDHLENRRAALEAGVDDFMAKPFDFATMTARLRAAERLAAHESVLSERNRTLQLAKERIESDLQAAARAQHRLLPPAIGRSGPCEVHSAFRPSSIVSGDMFNYFDLPGNRMGFYVIDVAGHGINAALLSVSLSHLITPEYFASLGIAPDGQPDPAALVAALNRRFLHDDGDEYFTMFCGVIDFDASRLCYCQAGYTTPMHLSAEGRLTQIGNGGFPVALWPRADFVNETASFARGDRLLLCSDGACEAENPAGEPFGQDRLEAVFRTAAEAEVTPLLLSALEAWRAGAPLEDDLTILTLKRNPAP